MVQNLPVPALLKDAASARFSRFTRSLGRWMAAAPQSISATLTDENADPKELAYGMVLIVLSAGLTRGNGMLSREEFLVLRDAFPLDDAESARIRSLFTLAWEEGTDPAPFAHLAYALYPNTPERHRQLLAHLCAVALADGPLKPEELRVLTQIGAALGFSRRQLAGLLAGCNESRLNDPFRVLGLERGAAMDEVKSRYRELMRRYHPDMVAAKAHYPEALAVAQRKSARIAEAYRTLADA